jgi:hypothetical protein
MKRSALYIFTNDIDREITKTMKEIVKAADTQDLRTVKALVDKATELDVLKAQTIGIYNRLLEIQSGTIVDGVFTYYPTKVTDVRYSTYRR